MPEIELNDEQKRAIQHGEGPLLIVAGAGTGKTRVLIERVGHLLRSVAGLKPENILALTFSRKAAAEMRQRAAARFSPAAAGARFSTFHSFCYELISNEIPSKPLDKIDQWIFLRRRLDKLDLDHYFKVSEPGRFLSDLVDFASRCHDNLVAPQDYGQFVAGLAADGPPPLDAGAVIPGAMGGRKRKPKLVTDPVAEFEAELKRQREVARVFQVMEQMQEQENYLSYGAMISRAVRLLDDSPELLGRLRAQYRYILVDEFQDTNTAQFELLVRLAGERANLTVVGDDDQAIYRFRGASYGSFEQFMKRYPGHRRVVLNRNYRSTKRILAVAGAAIAVNSQDRFMPDKQLLTDHAAGPKAEVWEFADADAQARYLAQEIARRIEQGEARDYSSCAVLYRAHAHRERLVEALRARGIPFAIRNLAVNDQPVMRDAIACLRLIAQPSDSVSLTRVLMDPRWQMPPATFVACCSEAGKSVGEKKRRRSLEEVIRETEWPGRELFHAFLARVRRMAEEQRMVDWFPLLAHELRLPRSESEKEPLASFSRFLARWDSEKCKTGMLDEFLEYFTYFEEAGGKISLNDDDSGEWTYSKSDEAEQARLYDEEMAKYPRGRVQLLTVHAAKGLEFDQVFVYQLVRRAFPSDHRKPLIELPTALWKGPLPRGDSHVEEERRLFYVALTRARHSLVLSTIQSQTRKPSRFVEDLRDAAEEQLLWKHPILSAGALLSVRESTWGPSPTEAWAAARGRDDAKTFTMSISQLETYDECPLKYFFRYEIDIPAPLTPALQFGTAMHAAVKDLMAAALSRPKPLEDLEVEAILNAHWERLEFPDPVQENKYRERGIEQLKGLRDRWQSSGIKLLHQEKSFEMPMAGCRVVGRIDQVHRRPQGDVELIEYKTGTPKTQKDAGEMRQLTLYGEACRRVLGLPPTALVLYNLTGQEALITTRTPEDLRSLEEEIRATREQILAGSFPAAPGYHCRYCDYRPICPEHEDRSSHAL